MSLEEVIAEMRAVEKDWNTERYYIYHGRVVAIRNGELSEFEDEGFYNRHGYSTAEAAGIAYKLSEGLPLLPRDIAYLMKVLED